MRAFLVSGLMLAVACGGDQSGGSAGASGMSSTGGASSSNSAGSSAAGSAGTPSFAGASSAGTSGTASAGSSSAGAAGSRQGGGAAGNSGSAGGSSAGSAGAGSGGSSTVGNGGAGGGGCHALENLGMDVQGKMAPGAFPYIGTNGAIQDGTYVLSSSIWYANTSPASQIRKRTLLIHGSELQTVTSENFGPDERVSFTINPADFLNQVPTCGLETDWSQDKKVAFGTSRPDQLVIREPYGVWSNRIDTYTLVK